MLIALSKSSLFLRRFLLWLNLLIIRWQLLLIILVLWLAGLWLKTHYGQEDSNLWIVLKQFLVILQWTITGLFAFSLIVAISVWLFFLYIYKGKKITVQVRIGDGEMEEAGLVPLTVTLIGTVIRPLLGTIRARLILSDKRLLGPVILDSNVYKKRALLRSGIQGRGETLLHDRGIYDVEKVQIIFRDMFNLISLPCTLPFSQQLYTLPREQNETKIRAQPNTTEEQKHRIEIPKRVEGEYISYKEFETGDNIRRIVWKIYAKSGQLVVRIPETKDPYASHLYFYASFYEGFNLNGGMFDRELLNRYKDKVCNIFEALQENGYDVRMPEDQEVPRLPGMSNKKQELFRISAAHWQNQNPPASFVSSAKAAFICISSLAPLTDVEHLLQHLPMTVPVVLVRLSDAIPSPFLISFRDLFFRPETRPYDKLRKPWFISPLRLRLQRNELEIQNALEKRGNGWVVSSIEIEK